MGRQAVGQVAAAADGRGKIKVDIPASEKAQDDYSIFEMNDTWLETTNAAYQQRGMLTYGCIFILAMGMIIVGVAVWALTNPPPNTSGTELMVAMAFVVVFMLLGFGIILVSLWGFLQELFTWTRIPIRFNRQTRMVHAYRGGGGEGCHFGPLGQGILFHRAAP